jgi:hypothetical protein
MQSITFGYGISRPHKKREHRVFTNMRREHRVFTDKKREHRVFTSIFLQDYP